MAGDEVLRPLDVVDVVEEAVAVGRCVAERRALAGEELEALLGQRHQALLEVLAVNGSVRECLQKVFEYVIDHCLQEAVLVAKVILQDSPGNPGFLGNAIGVRRVKAIAINAVDRGADDFLAGDIPLFGFFCVQSPTLV